MVAAINTITNLFDIITIDTLIGFYKKTRTLSSYDEEGINKSNSGHDNRLF